VSRINNPERAVCHLDENRGMKFVASASSIQCATLLAIKGVA